MYKLSFSEQGIARVLFSAGGGEDIRPQLQGVRKSMEIVENKKAGQENCPAFFGKLFTENQVCILQQGRDCQQYYGALHR
jgi:hypothetical protein